jgi:hypothetical protein
MKIEKRYISASTISNLSNEVPVSFDKISTIDRTKYHWGGSLLVDEDDDGQYFIVELTESDDFYHFYLVYVHDDGWVEPIESKCVRKDSYSTEKAERAMNLLLNDYYDFGRH